MLPTRIFVNYHYYFLKAIDGNYTEWSEWSECSVTCNGGVRSRTRTCSNPAPKNGGENCVSRFGAGEDFEDCNTMECGMWCIAYYVCNASWATSGRCSIKIRLLNTRHGHCIHNVPARRYSPRWLFCHLISHAPTGILRLILAHCSSRSIGHQRKLSIFPCPGLSSQAVSRCVQSEIG